MMRMEIHRQMGEVPNMTTEGSVVSSRKHSNYGTHTQNDEISCKAPNFKASSFQGQSIKDVEDGASNTDRKKPRKKTKEPVKLAQDIPNYVGDTESVDDLVKFIESGEKPPKKKVNQKTSPSSEFASKADKVPKKNKDKKRNVGQVDETTNTRNRSGEMLTSPNLSISEAPAFPPPPADIPPCVADASHTEEDMGNTGDKSAATSVVDSQTPPEEKRPHNKTETKVVLNKDADPPSEEISSSKSPPLHKEIEHKDRNQTKAKEMDKSLEPTSPVVSKKQKGKNGKFDLQFKNNKKLENKNCATAL